MEKTAAIDYIERNGFFMISETPLAIIALNFKYTTQHELFLIDDFNLERKIEFSQKELDEWITKELRSAEKIYLIKSNSLMRELSGEEQYQTIKNNSLC